MDGISYADPETIIGHNLYAYCGNNPVNLSIEQNNHLSDKIIIPERVKTSENILCGYWKYCFLGEHTKNKRPSSKETHERGLDRKRRDKNDSEKGDARGKFRHNGKHLKFEICENIINLFL